MRLVVVALVVIAGASLLLLLSGRRILVSEMKVQPGEKYVVDGYGNVGAAAQASLVCRYFTGRSIQVSVFWFALSGTFGRDSRPFIYGP